MKKGFNRILRCILVFIISIYFCGLSYGDEFEEDKNTWVLVDEDINEGVLYCFDENGNLRRNQITPDGCCTNDEGMLIVEDQVVRINTDYKYYEVPEEALLSGDPYIGRWLGTCLNNGKESHPFEIRIFRDEDGRLKLEFYDLKNGKRVKTNTYDLVAYEKGYERGWYAIKQQTGYEVFRLDSWNELSSGNLVLGESSVDTRYVGGWLNYYRIIE